MEWRIGSGAPAGLLQLAQAVLEQQLALHLEALHLTVPAKPCVRSQPCFIPGLRLGGFSVLMWLPVHLSARGGGAHRVAYSVEAVAVLIVRAGVSGLRRWCTGMGGGLCAGIGGGAAMAR